MRIFSVLWILLTSLTFSVTSFADNPPTELAKQVQNQVVQVNINTASAEELAKALTGIGINKAQNIIEYREKFGPFISIEQLKEVSGIGQSTLDKNIDKIVL